MKILIKTPESIPLTCKSYLTNDSNVLTGYKAVKLLLSFSFVTSPTTEKSFSALNAFTRWSLYTYPLSAFSSNTYRNILVVLSILSSKAFTSGEFFNFHYSFALRICCSSVFILSGGTL